MVQCGSCDHWIHAGCEKMSDESYEILSELPESVVFQCRLCQGAGQQGVGPGWREAVADYLQQSLLDVAGLLKSVKPRGAELRPILERVERRECSTVVRQSVYSCSIILLITPH